MTISRRGFTLVELLVAVGITAVLAAVLLSLVTTTITLWGRSAVALSMDNQATLILDRIQKDLNSAVVRRDIDVTWLDQTEGDRGMSLFRMFGDLANTSGDEDDPSTIREITYRMLGAGEVATLYRLEGTAEAALSNGYGPQFQPLQPDDEFLLSSGVRFFDLQYYRDLDTEVVSPSADDWPALVRVELVLVSPDGEQRLAAIAAGESTESVDQLLAQTSRRFVQWIELGGYPW
ncbi:prepilin-type N-terminal cleavage/methylation domain-containing protein [Opitutaceae bacterium]|nr:prepilin-type N-terminal cleavage/methylation domain-containing protein [Opitutaceae bacterium]